MRLPGRPTARCTRFPGPSIYLAVVVVVQWHRDRRHARTYPRARGPGNRCRRCPRALERGVGRQQVCAGCDVATAANQTPWTGTWTSTWSWSSGTTSSPGCTVTCPRDTGPGTGATIRRGGRRPSPWATGRSVDDGFQ